MSPSQSDAPLETRTMLKADLDRLLEQVDDLAEGRIERNAKIARLEADLGKAADALDAAAAALEEAGYPLGAQSARASATRARGQSDG